MRTKARPASPTADRLLIAADAGGSNGYRIRAREVGLARPVAVETACVTICLPGPPGNLDYSLRGGRRRPGQRNDRAISEHSPPEGSVGVY